LNRTRERLYGENNKKPTFQADRIRRTEGEILRVIILYGTNGISHGNLAETIKIDRKNLRAYTQRLIERKLIRREKGKQGRYFATGNPYGNTLYSAFLFGNMIKERILPDDTNISYFRPKATNDSELQKVLFELSNMLGALILYVLIQGLNPRNNQIIGSEENIEKDQLVQEWVHTTLSEVVGPDLLASFKDSILLSLRSITLNPEDPYTNIMEYLGKRPLFQLSEQVIKELTKAYARLYPVMFNALEEMRCELPMEVDKYEKHLDYMDEKRKQQNACKHEYTESTSRNGEIKHCRRCHHTVFPRRKY
jgi:hypothetical protein